MEEYVEVKINKAVVYLKPSEINRMLQQDLELFTLALKRGKGITRHNQQKDRERQKWEREQGFH
jgi:hypothetical protein